MKGKFYFMTNNRKIANSIFNTLRKEGIIVTGVEFLDGYFIFAMGEDSVVHFHVKALKNWKFGIWINMDYEKQTIKCFAQHEQFIDKFKPSDSLFLETVSRYSLCSLIENKDNARWVYYDIIKMIKHIKNNPRIALIQELNSSLYLDNPLWKMYLNNKKEVYDDKLYKIKKHIIEDTIPYGRNVLAIKLIKSMNLPLIKDITFRDLNNNDFGSIYFPRYEINVICEEVDEENKSQQEVLYKSMSYIKKLLTDKNTSIDYYIDIAHRNTESY